MYLIFLLTVSKKTGNIKEKLLKDWKIRKLKIRSEIPKLHNNGGDQNTDRMSLRVVNFLRIFLTKHL